MFVVEGKVGAGRPAERLTFGTIGYRREVELLLIIIN